MSKLITTKETVTALKLVECGIKQSHSHRKALIENKAVQDMARPLIDMLIEAETLGYIRENVARMRGDK